MRGLGVGIVLGLLGLGPMVGSLGAMITTVNKGVIWKYHADPSDPKLRDSRGRTSCIALNPDPDYWSGPPVWAICGPYVRAALKRGDVLFFVPDVRSQRDAGLDAYICAGYFEVDEVLTDDRAMAADARFSLKYRRAYRVDLRRHLDHDGNGRTATLRRRNIIVGHPKRSRWLGRRGPALQSALTAGRVRDVALDVRRIRNLRHDETRRLLRAIRGSLAWTASSPRLAR